MKKILMLIIASIMLVACEGDIEEGFVKQDVNTHEEVVKSTEDSESDDIVKINSTLSSDELEYLDFVDGVKVTFSENTDEIIDSISESTSDKSMYSDTSWNKNLKDSFMRMSLAYNILKETSDNELVPNDFKESHLLLIDAFSKVDLAGNLMFIGIEDNINLTTINGSTILMGEAVDTMIKFDELLSLKLQSFDSVY